MTQASEERTAMSDIAEESSDDRGSVLVENEKTEPTTALGASLEPRPKLAKHPTPGAAMELRPSNVIRIARNRRNGLAESVVAIANWPESISWNSTSKSPQLQSGPVTQVVIAHA